MKWMCGGDEEEDDDNDDDDAIQLIGWLIATHTDRQRNSNGHRNIRGLECTLMFLLCAYAKTSSVTTVGYAAKSTPLPASSQQPAQGKYGRTERRERVSECNRNATDTTN
eukprot:COSAG05_NODE_2458_length_3037_cov_14.981280_4_plen_110_part_00